MFVMWRYDPDSGQIITVHNFKGTTEPGQGWLGEKMGNTGGTFVLQHNRQYRDAFKYGYHKGKYPAAVQSERAHFQGWRDKNMNGVVDYTGPIYTDVHGLNFHKTKHGYLRNFIGLFSAGCQVCWDADYFDRVVMPEFCIDFTNFTYLDYTLVLAQTVSYFGINYEP